MSTRKAWRPFPADLLDEALRLAQAIQDQNNGRPMNRVLLANAIDRKPASSEYRLLLSSAFKYGLTIGNEKSTTISLTDLGTSTTRPRDQSERAAGLKEAALKPELFKRIYEHYDNGKLPDLPFFRSVLERDFSVPREHCDECAQTLVANGVLAGIVRELKGTRYIITAGNAEMLVEQEEPDGDQQHGSNPDESLPIPIETPKLPADRWIFIGHGKNRKPLEQLEKVLQQFQIKYKVAIHEPQMARPISFKVAQVMRECHSAILIFTADEEFRRPDGQTVWRPSENAVYELGAASVLYENRVVIFKEDGVDFPTDFSDIGHIKFETDRLDVKGLDLIKELIGLGLVRVEAA